MITTTNSNSNPSTLFGIASNSIYIGATPLYGLTSIVSFVIISRPRPSPVPFLYSSYPCLQVLGLVALFPCTNSECRTYPERTYINPVLADLTDNDIYKNDSNTFLIDFTAYFSGLYTTTITLQEQPGGIGTAWNTIATLNNNTYGTYIPYNTVLPHPEYMGYIVSWQKVLAAFGEGVYRICFNISSFLINYCSCSAPFCLKNYSCSNAQNTVKFEVTLNGGQVGDAENPAILWDICFTNPKQYYTDSIRFEGFFGYEKDEYTRKDVEYNNGVIWHVRDETKKTYSLQTGRLPKWLLDRFRAYAMMAGGSNSIPNNDNLLVSDYNNNNADYLINRKGIIPDSGFEPQWVQNSRYARVKVQFKEDQQWLIRRRCCIGEMG